MIPPATRVPPRFSTSSSTDWPGATWPVKTMLGTGLVAESNLFMARRTDQSARVAKNAAQTAAAAPAGQGIALSPLLLADGAAVRANWLFARLWVGNYDLSGVSWGE